MTDIEGRVEPGFEPVRDAFARNFSDHGDLGAAFCLYLEGRPVVDLWGGTADEGSGRRWAEDTLALIFSTTKGATALCAHLLAQRGQLDLDAPVSDYWPEFVAGGKRAIPVRWLLSHRAGLPVLSQAPPPEAALDWDRMVALLAAQEPVWEPGTAHGYHALTYGWLVGEVVRRASGRDIGRFFADEVAGPLGLEFWIGLPGAQEPRVSRLVDMHMPEIPEGFDLASLPEEVQAMAANWLDPNSLGRRALAVTDPPLDWNAPEVHGAQIPAANGICTARSLARMYASLVGPVDGVRLLEQATLEGATRVQSEGPDRVLGVPTCFGSGFMLDSPFSPMGGPSSFGHYGAGGSLGFAHGEGGWAFGYVMNKMLASLSGDPRTMGLVEAVQACL